ncbi:MAG: ABC transporter substrate-binding protein [bacterium]|nr:ABC transporter substrate-binding protein [bacterium]
MRRLRRQVLVLLALTLSLSLVGLTGTATGQAVKNPDTFIQVSFGDWDTFDYAWAYDTSSHTVIFNVYEPLIFYDGGRTDRFVPRLATAVPSLQNGLISPDGKTYTFPIREGVKFHDGTPMTAEDAAYSLRRFLLVDRDGGPSSLLLEPILRMTKTRDDKGNLTLRFSDLERAVQVKGNNVVVTLKEPFGPFLSIMALWSNVASKKWAAANGDWDGTAATMARYNNLKKESSAFFEKANGTGPFKLERWDRAGKQVILVRNEGYWRTPARLSRVVFRSIDEAATRILMLKAGDADSIAISRREQPQVDDDPTNIRFIDNLPWLRIDGFFFTVDIDTRGNPDVGSGRLDGAGIPANFFSDIRVRRGFAYAFDYVTFLRDAFRNQGTLPKGMIPPGMLGFDAKREYFTQSREKAVAEFREAWGGAVWERGFRLTVLYNTGNIPREVGARILKDGVEALNPKFRVDVRGITWASYLAAMNDGKLPVFWVGWVADYPDPHNFAFHFLHSDGTFPKAQRFKNEELDRLVMQAIKETNKEKRQELYFQVNQKFFELAPSVSPVHQVVFRVQRSWVRGWYNNPVFPGTYFYTIFKR